MNFVEKQRLLAGIPDEDFDEFRAQKRRRLQRESEQKSSKLSTDSISISQSLVHPNLLSQQTEPEKSRNEPRSDSINAETNEQPQSLTGQASDNRQYSQPNPMEVDQSYQSSPKGRSLSRSISPPRPLLDTVSSDNILPSSLSRPEAKQQDEPSTISEPNSSNLRQNHGEASINNQQHHDVPQQSTENQDSEKMNTSIVTDITSPSNSPAVPLLRVTPRPRQTLESKRKMKAKKTSEMALKKKEEEEEKRMTPREYATKVQEKFKDELKKASEKELFLKNKTIFYVGGDYDKAVRSTRSRMDYLRKKGATVAPVYDPNTVTHIITDTNAKITLKALGLKSLDEIPFHIPTLRWTWISNRSDHHLFLHAAFAKRIDCGPEEVYPVPKRKKKDTRQAQDDWEFSRIEEFPTSLHEVPATNEGSSKTGQLIDVDSSTVAKKTADNDSTLHEFNIICDMVRGNHDLEFSDSAEENNVEGPSSLTDKAKPVFTCDRLNGDKKACPNQDVVDKLEALRKINEGKPSKQGDEQHWRLFSYGKSIAALKRYPKRIQSLEEAKSIKGVGEKTARKIMEIIRTGDLQRITYDNTEQVQVSNLLKGVYGVGSSTAYTWYSMGCRTLEDLKQRKGGVKLTDAQQIGLEHYEDINTRIPREEVTEIFNSIKKIALSIDPNLFVEVMGSYRRGKETCGDIDILMTRPTYDGRDHRGMLGILLKKLHEQKILTEDLAIPEDMEDLELTYRGLCRHGENGRRRRIDILVIPWQYRGAALLYYTGDDIFNRAMRFKAKKMGYSLSQRGLSAGVLRNQRGKKLVPGKIIASETEEEIFRILDVPWQEPYERVRS